MVNIIVHVIRKWTPCGNYVVAPTVPYGKKITICTVKVTRNGLKCARPCMVCIQWMERYNIDKVIYSENNNYIRIVSFKVIREEEKYMTRTQRENLK